MATMMERISLPTIAEQTDKRTAKVHGDRLVNANERASAPTVSRLVIAFCIWSRSSSSVGQMRDEPLPGAPVRLSSNDSCDSSSERFTADNYALPPPRPPSLANRYPFLAGFNPRLVCNLFQLNSANPSLIKLSLDILLCRHARQFRG